MASRTDFEREAEREINEDAGNGMPGKRKKRKAGGATHGLAVGGRLDRRARRQSGGVARTRLQTGGMPAMGPQGAPQQMPAGGGAATIPPQMLAGMRGPGTALPPGMGMPTTGGVPAAGMRRGGRARAR
jgi:hypothetical protein